MMEQEPNTFSVRLTKRPPHGLGFLVRKRKNNPPVVISDLSPGGVAEQSGLVQIGDILIAVNGVQLRDVPYNTALEVLRSVPMDSACVIVLRGPDNYRTRLESVLGPDGSVRVVRITDVDPEIEKSNHSEKRRGRIPGGSPSAQGWGKSLHTDHVMRYGGHSPVRRARSATRSPSRGSHTGSPIRTFAQPHRDQSPCCCTRNITTEYQSVMAWNGSFPREVYQYRLPSDDCFYETSPRPSLDYEYDQDRMRNGVDDKGDLQYETKGTQWPERVFLVRSRSGLSGVSTPGTENGFEVIPKLCPYDSGPQTPTNEQSLNGLNVPPVDIRENIAIDDVTTEESNTDSNITYSHDDKHINGDARVFKEQGTFVNGNDGSMSDTSIGDPNNKKMIKTIDLATDQPNNKRMDDKVQTCESEVQTDVMEATCPVIGPIGNSALVPAKKDQKQKFVRLKNLIDGKQFTDTLHQKTFLAFNNLAPPYLTEQFSVYVPARALRSSQDKNRLVVPKTNLAIGDRSFTVSAARAWNDLPPHMRTVHSVEKTLCTEDRCMGSIMFPPRKGEMRSKEEMSIHAVDFINQYYAHIRRVDTPAHKKRLAEVTDSIERTGTYSLTETELMLGAKTAWRNAPRCIGRIQWTKLQVFDCRNVRTTNEMFDAICNHLSYATNKGNLRSAITIFPPRKETGKDFRVWNSQLVSYAAYKQEDGTFIGDPINFEFTEICVKMGWKGAGTNHDILPLVLQAEGADPEMFDIPGHLILEVDIEHPKYPWFKEDLKFKWYAIPAVSALMLDVGGIEFPGIPFSGWYMVTEIGARDMCDPSRYNLTEKIAQKMGLDTSTNANLWKDQALVEANVAVLYSYQKNNVNIVDHHTASESFMKHLDNEQRLRGGCPGDWVWVVPPISGSITPVFHQEMLNYQLKPSYEYQDPAWVNHVWKGKSTSATEKKRRRSKLTFKEVAKAVKFSAKLMGKAMAKRMKATILFATETGKSETYAKTLSGIFNHAFDAKVMNMEDYDVAHLEHETLLLVVTSTFGNGDPPENGELFGRYLMELACGPDDKELGVGHRFDKYSSITTPETPSQPPKSPTAGLLDYSSGILGNVRFSVFALGSKAYPKFAAFGRAVDALLGELGGERIMQIGLGDELSGQEQSFKEWAADLFKTACDVFCVGGGVDMKEANASLTQGDQSWAVEKFRISEEDEKPALELCEGLSKLHNKTILPTLAKRRENLQSKDSERSTILVEIDTQGASELLYAPGDHAGICPANERDLVDRILKRIDTDIPHDATIKCEFLEQKNTPLGTFKAWVATGRLPLGSLRMALTHYLDITTPPTPNFLHMLSIQAQDDSEKAKLMVLSKDPNAYEDWKFDHSPSVPEVLEQFPSVKVSPSFLLTELPIIKPRFYSISSSLKMFPGEIHMTVAVVWYHTGKNGDGPRHNGVCSSYLNRVGGKEIVPCFIRTAPLFHLPEERHRPVIMVGPGTGIAPFRSFWQERLIDIQLKKGLNSSENNFGNMTLVFGCRKSIEDNIYRHETKQAQKDGALRTIWTALSRELNMPKTYVQDMLRSNSTEVFDLIDKLKGHFYVCGDVQMAAEVGETLEDIIAQEGRMSTDKAKAYLSNLRNSNMYHEDIFGVTLRTKEVQNKLRASRRAKVFVTGADNKLQPAVPNGEATPPKDGNVNGNHIVKSFEDVRLDANGHTGRALIPIAKPKPRRSITATVLMSEDELADLQKLAEQSNTQANTQGKKTFLGKVPKSKF